MMTERLLHVSASPRGAASESLALAKEFLQAFAETQPDVEIDDFDLWDGTLPDFGPDAAAAKMTVFAGETPSGQQAEAWARAREVFERFNGADRYLFSVPMWNAGIPYILKQFIDVISQPGMVFSFDPEQGYTGLVTGKKAALIYTSAVYGPGRPPAFGSDFQAPYLNDWLHWAGIHDIAEVEFRPTFGPAAEADRCIARQAARDLGKRF